MQPRRPKGAVLRSCTVAMAARVLCAALRANTAARVDVFYVRSAVLPRVYPISLADTLFLGSSSDVIACVIATKHLEKPGEISSQGRDSWYHRYAHRNQCFHDTRDRLESNL